MISMYKKVSTLLTIACLLYMCLISIFHLSPKVGNKQSRGQDHPSLIRGDRQNLGHNHAAHNWTSEEQRIPATEHVIQKTTLSKNDFGEFADKSSTEELTDGSFTKNRGTEASRTEAAEEWQPVRLRNLREKTQQHTSDPRPEHTTAQVNHFLTNTIMSPVSQYKVNFLHLGDNFYVYSIFLDKRYSSGDYVRLLVLRPTLDRTRQLLCRFYTSQNRSISVKAEPYEMCENHGRKYGGWIYSCQVPETGDAEFQTITFVSMTENKMDFVTLMPFPLHSLNNGSFEYFHKLAHSADNQQQQGVGDKTIKLTSSSNLKSDGTNETGKNIRQKPRPAGDMNTKIGVCVPPLHGDICLSKVINFIEMCRLLGADKVFLYIHDIPLDIFAFLQNYTGLNPTILTLVLWDLPITHKKTPSSETNQFIWNHGQLLAVQHCLYTNMDYFDWLLFIDIDEMLIPQKTQTWPGLLTEVTNQFYSQFQNITIAGISFESAFFQQDFQTQVTNSIGYFQYLHRTRETSAQRSKLFVQPFQVFEVGIHHLSRAVSEEMGVIRAETDQALVHHYRKCVPDDDPMSDLQCEILVKDESILRYEVPLTIASREVIAGAMKFFLHNR